MAGVLAIARAVKKMTEIKPPKRTIRFVLFNAEENGLIGSWAYARAQAALEQPIIAVYQMDMIGYNGVDPRTFQVHAGYRKKPDVEQRSLELAERISALREAVSPNLPPPEIHPLPNYKDAAEGRSDHSSFHLAGYPACVTCEEFFPPIIDRNPNYQGNAGI